ncbi:LruC domain-containing protein [Bacteroides sp. 214]|uniref:LruC domain-containing protein n=1 Tax=Bacteroides sp. 214 TaxID=2302935 RepID=UPI0013D7D385|nr:LruC domain-containing protein [Bacteroides sp. 214]NDW13650.1 LruC domain-containing protein [Bacteroides sp. 214]
MTIVKMANQLTKICIGLLLTVTVIGCSEKDLYVKPEVPDVEDYFNFTTTSDVTVSLNYGLNNYQVIFEIYDENPVITDADGVTTITEKEPLYRSITASDGTFSHEITIPSSVTEVYLYSDYIGVLPCVKLPVNDSKVTFNQSEYLSGNNITRAQTDGGRTYPDGYKTLGDWSKNGMPSYLKGRMNDIPAGFLYSIRKLFSDLDGTEFPDMYPQYFDNPGNIDIRVTKETAINLAFLGSGAFNNNVVGYYTYPTNNPPQSRDDIKNPIIAFPRITSVLRSSPVFSGDYVSLKYWNEETDSFEDKFPAGISIGWLLISDGFTNNEGDIIENLAKTATFYSTDNEFRRLPTDADKMSFFNTVDKGLPRALALVHDPVTKHMISLTFEDRMTVSHPNDYYDAAFYVQIVEEDAIETPPVLPPVNPPSTYDVYVEYSGILAFEDNWPTQGDYDMNDLVIKYKSRVYRNMTSPAYVSRIVDEFTVLNNGATYINGFGYQFYGANTTTPLADDRINKITIENAEGIVSKFMQGQDREPGQNTPTIILFDNAKEVVGKTFTVTTEVNTVYDRLMQPPYNPFIIVKTNEGRGREVHMVKYPPTALADMDLFGTKHDESRPEDKLYYVSSDNFPFALHLSKAATFNWPEEGVRIDVTYPKYADWAKSSGKTNTDWYK